MPALPAITTISFDADGTLWDFRTVMRHALEIALAELQRRVGGYKARRLTIEDTIALHVAAGAPAGEISDVEAVRFAGFQRTLEHIGVHNNNLARHLGELYWTHRREDIQPYPDAPAALEALGGRRRLAVVANGGRYPERCGLRDRLDFMVFSETSAAAMPDPRIFDRALGVAGCRREEWLHVGDCLATDVQGAKNASIRCAWLNRDGLPADPDTRPDFELSTLADLPGLLANL